MPVLLIIAIVGVAILLVENSSAQDSQSNPDNTMEKPGTIRNQIATTDIAQYALNAGWDASNVLTAVAIALAESKGDANAYNPETAANTPAGMGSVGLWQVYQKAHPEDAGLDLTDPQTNADAAFQIYSKAGGFTPWTTYTGLWRDSNGDGTYGPVVKHTPPYLSYLDSAQTAYDSVLAQSQNTVAADTSTITTTPCNPCGCGN